MSQRIHLNPNRGQPAYAPPAYSAGYSPDPISTSRPATSDNELVAKIQQVSGQVEDMIEIYTQVRWSRRRAARSEGRAAVARTQCAVDYNPRLSHRPAHNNDPRSECLRPRAQMAHVVASANPSPSAHMCRRSRASSSS
jgi:hypothetical protein